MPLSRLAGIVFLQRRSNGILMVDPVSMESKPVLESVVYGIGVNEFFPCGDRLFILTDLGICVYENGEYIQDRNLPYGVFVDAALDCRKTDLSFSRRQFPDCTVFP